MAGTTNPKPEIPEERRFVWRNMEAFLSGELSEQERARIEAFLCECPYTREYVETEKQFVEAVRRCVNEEPVECPSGLRDRILTALDRCETEEEPLPPQVDTRHFPWLGAVVLTAAGIMLVVALVVFGGGKATPRAPGLPGELAPMVAHVSLDCPRGGKCKFNEADKAYRKYFAGAPALPREFGGAVMKVASYDCVKMRGERVMCTVYDAPDGERFGFITFCSDCVKGVVPREMRSAEIMVNGKLVLMWREGKYIRALIGNNETTLNRHMRELRDPV